MLSFTIFYLWVWSSPITANLLNKIAEQSYPSKKFFIPNKKLDGIILLGGQVTGIQVGNKFIESWSISNRFWVLVDTIKKTGTKHIIISGGRSGLDKRSFEQFYIEKRLRDIYSFDEVKISKIRPAINTKQEAFLMSNYLNKSKCFYLITSSFHMPRAVNEFENLDICVRGIASDFKYFKDIDFNIWAILPSPYALLSNSITTYQLIARSYVYLAK